MKKQKTIISFILDKSGSMGTVKDATISGFNEYVNTLKNDKSSDYEFSLTLFDTSIIKTEASPINKTRLLTENLYNPGGNTALYDAVCSTIKGIKENKTQKVLIVIMTDGEENSSKEYTQVHMRDLIREKEKNGNWTFVFLGANQDSYKVAQAYGMQNMNNVANFNATNAGVGATMRNVAQNTVMYASSLNSSSKNFFSAKDQSDLKNIE